jgi:hypothetical protein
MEKLLFLKNIELFRTNFENTTCFRDVAYPPHKIDKNYAYECKHSTHIFYQFCMALNSYKLSGGNK